MSATTTATEYEIVPPPTTQAQSPSSVDPVPYVEATKTAEARLHPTLSSADDFIAHLQRCIRTRRGTNTVLLFTTYLARLISAILATLGSSPSIIPTGSFIVLPPTLALALSRRLKAFMSMMDDWCTMNRLWGILGVYFAAKDLVSQLHTTADKSKEKMSRPNGPSPIIQAAQVTTLGIYHITEAAAYFSRKNIVSWPPKLRARLATASVRAWTAYIVVDLVRLLLQGSENSSARDSNEAKKRKAEWMTELTHNLAWLPLTINWGVSKPFLPELVVATLGAYPSFSAMRSLWGKSK